MHFLLCKGEGEEVWGVLLYFKGRGRDNVCARRGLDKREGSLQERV